MVSLFLFWWSFYLIAKLLTFIPRKIEEHVTYCSNMNVFVVMENNIGRDQIILLIFAVRNYEG